MREFAREFALVDGIGAVAGGPIVLWCSHGLLIALLYRSAAREGEGEDRQIE